MKAMKRMSVTISTSLVLLFLGVLVLGAVPVLAAGPGTIYQVYITDVRGVGFTVSWATDNPSDGAVLDTGGALITPGATDTAMSTVHYVVVTGLSENTPYQFQVRSCDASLNCGTDNNGGAFYSVTTGPALGGQDALTLYGQVTSGGNPANGAVVYLQFSHDGTFGTGEASQWVSAQQDNTGFWNYSLGDVRLADFSNYYFDTVVGPISATARLVAQGGISGTVAITEVVPSDILTTTVSLFPVSTSGIVVLDGTPNAVSLARLTAAGGSALPVALPVVGLLCGAAGIAIVQRRKR